MPIDTSMYPTSQSPNQSNPLNTIENAMQTKMMMDRIQRGSPQTEGSLDLLGAGAPMRSSWNDNRTTDTNSERNF